MEIEDGTRDPFLLLGRTVPVNALQPDLDVPNIEVWLRGDQQLGCQICPSGNFRIGICVHIDRCRRADYHRICLKRNVCDNAGLREIRFPYPLHAPVRIYRKDTCSTGCTICTELCYGTAQTISKHECDGLQGSRRHRKHHNWSEV